MTPSYACTVCGAVSDQKQCPEHRRRGDTSWGGTRDRTKQAAFRRAVLARDGSQCVAVNEATGERCPVTDGLRAAHYPTPLREFALDDPAAYDPSNGITLCAEHDKLIDPYAR